MFGRDKDAKPQVDKVEHRRGDTRKLAKVVFRKTIGGALLVLALQNLTLLPAWIDNSKPTAAVIHVLGMHTRPDAPAVASATDAGQKG